MKNSIFAVLFLIPCITIAQNAVDRLVLKDGSLHEGYIKKQRIGKDFIFVSEKSIILATDATISNKQSFNLNELPEHWKKWANENKENINSKKRSLTLSSIIFKKAKKEGLDNVVILEEGENIKLVDLSAREDTIPISDIQAVERIPMPDSILSKTIDVISKKGDGDEGILKGQIISQIPGEKVKIKLEDGVVKVVKFPDIISESKEKVCLDLSFCEQSKYLEIVRTSTKDEYEGVITMRYYGSGSEDGYIIVTDTDDKPHKILMKNVTEIQKKKNRQYQERKELVVEGDKVYINQICSKWFSTETQKKFVIIPQNTDSLILRTDASSVNMKTEIIMENSEDNRACMLLRIYKIPKDSRYFFSCDTVIENEITPQKETVDEKGILCKTFNLEKGKYVLYRRKDKQCILLIVK